MLSVLIRHPEFRRLWAAQAISQGGDWLNRIAVLALIGDLQGPTAALGVGEETGGAYDVTVGPLVELWGFGAGGRGASVPGEEAIARARARTGAGHLRLDAAGGRVFKGADVALDFSSLAKGYAVDRVSDYLLQAGVSRHLVEIGGELRGRGTRPGGDPWRIAVEKPSAGAREPARIIDVTDIAVATSGDYRNFFEIDGQRYSHSIDPRSGYPVDHDLVSVTVLHDSAMLADAWATALVVLGYNAASRLSGQFGLAAFFIRRSEGGFEEAASPAFSAYIK